MLGEATAFDGVRAAIMLKGFKLGDEAVSKYTLQFDNCTVLTNGTDNRLCDSWEYSNNRQFSTLDVNNDCTHAFNDGAWWHFHCFKVNFNGRYSKVPTVAGNAKNIHWVDFRGLHESLKETKMLIRRTVQ